MIIITLITWLCVYTQKGISAGLEILICVIVLLYSEHICLRSNELKFNKSFAICGNDSPSIIKILN